MPAGQVSKQGLRDCDTRSLRDVHEYASTAIKFAKRIFWTPRAITHPAKLVKFPRLYRSVNPSSHLVRERIVKPVDCPQRSKS